MQAAARIIIPLSMLLHPPVSGPVDRLDPLPCRQLVPQPFHVTERAFSSTYSAPSVQIRSISVSRFTIRPSFSTRIRSSFCSFLLSSTGVSSTRYSIRSKRNLYLPDSHRTSCRLSVSFFRLSCVLTRARSTARLKGLVI